MAALSSPGIGSGLDINGLVTKLMSVEQQPLVALTKKEADYQSKLSAYGTLKGALSSLQTAVAGLSSPVKYNSTKATAADATVLTASTTTVAKPASYTVNVTTLAQAHKLSSVAVSDPTASMGTGSLKVEFGTYNADQTSFALNGNKTSKTITIDASNSSLNGIRDAINNASAGVTASIINDGTGYRLVMSSNDSGAENAMRLTVVDNDGNNTDSAGLSRLAYDPPNTVSNMTQSLQAKSAVFTVDGIPMTKSSNTVSDAIAGVTFTLLKESSSTTMTVTRDTSGVKSSVEAFVKAYNEAVATVKELGGYDAKTKKGGVLLGDSALRTVQSTLRNIIGQQVSFSGGGVSSLSEIGVSFQKDGTLKTDSTKLNAVLADSTKNVGSLFATMGIASDSLVSYASSTSSTLPGRYSVTLSAVASRAKASGDQVLAAPVVIDANNKVLGISVDGTAGGVNLTEGTYNTLDALVAEIQTRVNSHFSLVGKKVTVSQTGGQLTITSDTYGSSSNVTLTGGNAVAALFGTVEHTAGVDVAGEIGGTTATGSGQYLTGAGSASGLQLLVSGGVTGARGTISFSSGIAAQLDKAIGSLLDKEEGTITGRENGVNSSIKDIENQRTAINRRLVDVERRYRAQFTALDQMVASMQQTSSYLTQQLAALSSSTSSK
jgi:flagellar hook-associated protein 2